MPKVRLTKKRLQRLDMMLSVDDILHEKFRRLNLELQQEWRKIYRAQQVVRVIKRCDGTDFELMIVEHNVTPDGTIVVVRDAD